MSTSAQKPSNGEILLEMRGLRIEGQSEGGWQEIVKGVDVTLRRGEVLGLIGESGAGKSTIGIAGMGFARPGCRISGGMIVFDGMDLRAASDEQLRKLRGSRIAYVAQSAAASFNPAHKLIDQYSEAPIQHGIKGKAEAEKDAMDLYRRLRLPDPESIGFRYPHQVSGGQLQRAMTAMAMACRPDLIVFDEPTTALDVTTQIEVLAAIKDVVKEFNTAAIYITHDLAVVAQMADRIMVLRYGDLVEEGNARDMLADPQQDYTRQLLSVRSYRKQEAPPDKAEVPLLEVRNVTASYGGTVKVLEDIDLKIGRGRTVAVVGESGSGKSTLARVITGLLPPVEGAVLFNGEELPASYKKRTRDQLRHAQMIYQMPDTALNPRQRIRDIIGRPAGFYLGLTGAARESRVRELLEMIELDPDEFIDRFPEELSGGQKQRICIARALAAEPELIICDEVTSALDQLVAEEILKLLQRLQDDLGVTYLFITHDLATVRAISDEVVVMLQGKVVEHGGRQDIFTPPHHDYTDLLLSSVPEMDPDWLDNLLAERAARKARGEAVMESADQ
ncbi:MAG: ABC transporter ATP-binding protein [Alphaproteobacteria bacterium]|nr:ABC transporter ATP-binding protein [Alphaproteobacteria bacterium]